MPVYITGAVRDKPYTATIWFNMSLPFLPMGCWTAVLKLVNGCWWDIWYMNCGSSVFVLKDIFDDVYIYIHMNGIFHEITKELPYHQLDMFFLDRWLREWWSPIWVYLYIPTQVISFFAFQHPKHPKAMSICLSICACSFAYFKRLKAWVKFS